MSVDAMREYYAARAPEYDRVYKKPERRHDLRAIERWLPSVLSGRSILEVACGTGYWTQFFAPAAKEVVALDVSAETLAIAKVRVPASHVQFVSAMPIAYLVIGLSLRRASQASGSPMFRERA